MRINFLVNEVNGGWGPADLRLGGTEESVVNWAEELVKRGHEVTVFRNYNPLNEAGYIICKGVSYEDRGWYGGKTSTLGDICINVKSSEVSPKEPTLYLTNEVDASNIDLSAYKGVIWPSQWAVDNIPVNNKTFILPHGYDPKHVYPDEKKIPKQCFYASSPDRGLDVLLKAWPKVSEAHPDATLILTYGGKSDLPGVITLGEADDLTMDEIYNSSDVWCHPCTGGELYCMTGKKAQVAGCIPVIIPTMALSETVRRGFKVEDPKDYAQSLIEVLNMPMELRDVMRKEVIKEANASTWEESTDTLLEIINSVLST